MKKLSILLLFFAIAFFSKAQSPGDTIIVSTFNYSQTYGVNRWSPGIRDSVMTFPSDTSIHFEKILMYYNIRCKDGLVSPPISGQTDKGCGEWDYSCNTYIHDSSRVDSFLASHKSHIISNFSGTSFDYYASPLNAFYRYFQQNVVIDSIITDSQATVGIGSSSNDELIKANSHNAKRQYLFTKNELMVAGVDSGNIDGIILDAINGTSVANYLKIRIKASTKTILTNSFPDSTGFIEVYFHNYNFVAGQNRIQFYTPFVWDGNSNIIIEYSYSNNQAISGISFNGTATNQNMGLLITDDNSFNFDGVNFIETDTYKGIPGAQSRTIEAWIKTTTSDKEIVSWGQNANGEKWVFRVNGGGQLRVEVAGGYTYGTTLLNDGNWHHVACVLTGNNVISIKLYVDGVLETGLTTANITINTDTTNGINLRISRGVNNRYFNGNIDEVRIWDTILTEATIQEHMYSSINSSHPNYSHLQAYYKLDENAGEIINDASGHNRNAHSVNSYLWSTTKGIDLFKSLNENANRPNTTFLQGDYNLIVSNDTILDTIAIVGHNVKEYSIESHAGTINSDVVLPIMDTTFWQLSDEYVYDANTMIVIDTVQHTKDGTINITNLDYYKRSPMKFEIMSFVTPYGINLNLGPNGKTWTFDVTDFTPILRGVKRMTVERGGQWQEDMDIKFAFIVGTPPREVLNIRQIWPPHYKSYADINAEKYFAAKDVDLNTNAKGFKVRSTITGHGQEGEFIARNHYLNVNGGSKEFVWQVWKTCGSNPIYPQGGTWIFDRAGWCPGSPTTVNQYDITDYIGASNTVNLDYGIEFANGSSNYIVNNQLVEYGDTNFTLDIAVEDITAPTNKVEYRRTNSICNNPGIIIKNTGKTPITSATIEYWVNNNSQRNTYQWTGLIKFGETLEVTVNADDQLWSSLIQGENVFHAKVLNPNGSTDEYSFNDEYTSNFVIPEVLPSVFKIRMRTNNAASETSYKLYNNAGTMIFHKHNLSNNKNYTDTFKLGVGCYKLEILDSDGDGLKFFANNDGNGSIAIRKLNNVTLKNFNGDFGNSIIYNFTVDYPLTYEELHKSDNTTVYPNPNNGKFFIGFEGQVASNYYISDVMGRIIMSEDIKNINNKRVEVSLQDQVAGVYFVTLVFDGGSTKVHKIVVE